MHDVSAAPRVIVAVAIFVSTSTSISSSLSSQVTVQTLFTAETSLRILKMQSVVSFLEPETGGVLKLAVYSNWRISTRETPIDQLIAIWVGAGYHSDAREWLQAYQIQQDYVTSASI